MITMDLSCSILAPNQPVSNNSATSGSLPIQEKTCGLVQSDVLMILTEIKSPRSQSFLGKAQVPIVHWAASSLDFPIQF
jgi:hypothetical protein